MQEKSQFLHFPAAHDATWEKKQHGTLVAAFVAFHTLLPLVSLETGRDPIHRLLVGGGFGLNGS
jgi:hypothetical protein